MTSVQITLLGSEMSPEDVREFLDIANARGFIITGLNQKSGDVENLILYLYGKVTMTWPKRRKECYTRFEQLSLQSLQQCRVAWLMQTRPTHNNDKDDCVCFEIETRILELMMQRGVSFADCNPTRVFKTELDDTNLSVRSANILKRHGLKWAEQLNLLRLDDVATMRGKGPKLIGDVQRLIGRPLPKAE